MRTFLLPATEADIRLLAKILQQQGNNPEYKQQVIELEKKWIVPTRQQVTGEPAISHRAEEVMRSSIFFDFKDRAIIEMMEEDL